MASTLSTIILAAGQGTRMHSHLPKVLHVVGSKPMLAHVIDTVSSLGPAGIHIVHGHDAERVRTTLDAHHGTRQPAIAWCHQQEQRGTAHAVDQAMPTVPDDHVALILYGDVPLITTETLERLVVSAEDSGIAALTAHMDDPAGYGRILRDNAGHISAIVEERDATDMERAIHEVNTGVMAARAGDLRRWLARVDADNAQGEYYLTDCIALAVADGFHPTAVVTRDHREATGVNNRVQLAEVESIWRERQAEGLMLAGVTVRDPRRLDIRGSVDAAGDVELDVGVIIEGHVVLGEGVRVGAYSVLRNCILGAGTVVESHTVIDGAQLAEAANVGPFARLRPGTELAKGSKVGNFVEVKASRIGAGSKVNHLAYVGDTLMGAEVNVGAGTITCNYDGANKHTTTIGDRVFIGSDCQLVAPVRIGDDATIGAGTTLTRDAPAGQLTLSRTKARSLSGWQRPSKDKGE